MEVRVGPRPLSLAAAYRELDDPHSGGVVLFAGRVRAGPMPRGPPGPLSSLEYEAHAPLAEASLRSLGAAARKRFGVRGLVLWHRTGVLGIGTISLIVGVAAPHRESAFRAARWLISELKRKAPIWKTERARSGRRPPRPPGPRVVR